RAPVDRHRPRSRESGVPGRPHCDDCRPSPRARRPCTNDRPILSPERACDDPAMADLVYRERAAAAEPKGLLLLHHGRGADETDLLALGDHLDPERRLHVVAPRAPLTLGGPGYHWYVVPRVGYP